MAEARHMLTGPLQVRQTEDGVIVARQRTELGDTETMILSAKSAALLAEAILDLQGLRDVLPAIADHIEELSRPAGTPG